MKNKGDHGYYQGQNTVVNCYLPLTSYVSVCNIQVSFHHPYPHLVSNCSDSQTAPKLSTNKNIYIKCLKFFFNEREE